MQGRASGGGREQLRVLYTNAQSIRGKIGELNYTKNDLDPDLILLTETWCSMDTTDAFLTIDGYNLQTDLRRDRTDTPNGVGGGLLVYTKVGLEIFTCDNGYDFNQYCKFGVRGKTEPLYLYLVYRSPNAPKEDLVVLGDLLKSAEKNCLIIGDFNLPEVAKPEKKPSARVEAFIQDVKERGLTQMVTFPTQVRGNILDLAYTDVPDKIILVEDCGRLGKSDHVMIMITIAMEAKIPDSSERVSDWRRANWEGLREAVQDENWRQLVTRSGAEGAWEAIKTRLHEAVVNFVPTKARRNANNPTWMTREILQKIRRKRRLWKKAKHGEDTEEYKKAEKEVNNMIRNAKRKLEKKLAFDKVKNSKPFYAYVKKRTKTRTTVGPIKTASGQLTKNDNETAEELNKFFSSVFTKETGETPRIEDLPFTNKLERPRITTHEVKKKLDKLKPHSAAGPDGIGPRVLRELSGELAPPLAHVFRRSLDEKKVPNDWKKANVTPIHKKGPKAEPGNYRPVSLTSVTCKLMESLLKDKIIEHLRSNKMEGTSQHGFAKGRSCTTNLLEFLEVVTESADKGVPVDVIFLDFAKAFDKVPHRRLMTKVKAFGIQGLIYGWIKDWLTGRTQRVVLNGCASGWEEVLSGVPQGSVLGPVLFSLFIHDIDEAGAKLNIIKKFADDTKGAKTVRGVDDKTAMQTALNELNSWAERWGMAFNLPKCKVMHVGHGNPGYEYEMNGKKLEVTEQERDIGVIMTRNLRPKAQCERAAGTAMGVLRQIERAFHYRDRVIFLRLYKQYVRPHLEFAVQAWSPWTAGDIDCLEKVQIRAVKMVSGLRGRTYSERLDELDLPTLEERRREFDMVQVYKILSGKDNVSETQWFERAAAHSQGRATTRLQADNMNLRPKFGRTEVRRNFFSERVVQGWNILPSELKRAKDVSQFKRGLRRLNTGASNTR